MNRHKRTIHVISHSHWDREWYMPFELHRMRLVELMDSLLALLEHDHEFRGFHLDGQTIILDDYLEIRPERRDQVERLCREGRLSVGPWYVLQDLFLASGEASVRNLQIGMRAARSVGCGFVVGYFPDSFGIIGQAPQLIRQAGMETAVFGRGVVPTGGGRDSAGRFESAYSEMSWISPDGSEVLGVLFANWYNNGMEIPSDPDKAVCFWPDCLAAAERFASTPELLVMNGCDHQPAQGNLAEALSSARALFPEDEFIHSNFAEYLQALRSCLPQSLSRVRGELRSQRTDGWSTLVNTASSRMELKQANQECQALLERLAEPLATLASTQGFEYPHSQLDYAWKTLIQNHPHDSICGCGVDEVHKEMQARFAKSAQVARAVAEKSADRLCARIDTSGFERGGGKAFPFVVFNTFGWDRSCVQTVDLEVARGYLGPGASPAMARLELGGPGRSEGCLVDEAGKEIACLVEDLGPRFGYELPDDAFRRPYYARVLRLKFEALGLPALGYRSYAWVAGPLGAQTMAAIEKPARPGGIVLENEFLRVEVAEDGSFSLADSRSGARFKGLGVLEDTGDIGNEYVFRAPPGCEPISTKGRRAELVLVERSPIETIVEIRHSLEIPSAAASEIDGEREAMVPVPERSAGRGSGLVPLAVSVLLRLGVHAEALSLSLRFHNDAKDHRLRILFPTDIAAETCRADSAFEVVERGVEPCPEWRNPSNCQHQQAFVDFGDARSGLTVANRGLCEYEILRDGRNTIAVTLLRSVGEMGDWGVFPTPEAQCLGERLAELELIPRGKDPFPAYAEAYRFQAPAIARQAGTHEGSLPPSYSFLAWSGPALALSAVKLERERGDVALRWFNMGAEKETLTCAPAWPRAGAWKSGILEERGESVEPGLGLPVRPAEIVTILYGGPVGEGGGGAP